MKPNQTSPAKLTGLWWNVWLSNRDKADGAKSIVQKLRQLVEQYELDWVCLQEAFVYQPLGPNGHLPDLLEQALGWQGVYEPGATFDYLNGVESAGGNFSFGLATYSRWPIQHRHLVKLGEVRSKAGQIIDRRSLLETTLETSHGPVTVGNTHWTRMQWLLWRCRGREMKAFAKRIETLPPPQAYAVGGDFNTLAFHPIIGRLRRSLDLRTGSLKQPTWRHLAQPNSILKTNIDYVGSLRSGDLRLTNLTVLERQPSDHAPMLATFELEGGRG